MFDNKFFADIKLVVRNKVTHDKKCIHSSKCVLANASVYFYDLFTNGSQDEPVTSFEIMVESPQEADYFEDAIRCIYGRTCKLHTQNWYT